MKFFPLLRWILAAALLPVPLLGCGGDDDEPPIDRGPTTITLAADPNGAYWDATERRLYLTDDVSNAILVWNGEFSTTFATYAALPALVAPATSTQTSLGELARAPDNSFYVTRFGFGNAGTVIEVAPARTSRNLSGLDATRRRIALTRSAAGEWIDSWFTTPPSPAPATTNGRVGLPSITAAGAASERELVTGLAKPVGVATVGRTLYVSDQASGKLLSFPLDAALAAPVSAASGTTVATFTTNLVSGDSGALTADNIDLLTASGGALYVGGRGGRLFRVDPATGTVTTLLSVNTTADPGRLQIRGVAHDAANRRLFVVVHSTDIARAPHQLRIVPLD